MLFADHGYTGASTRAIALAAGVNLAQLHYYFGSKRDLFRAAYMRGAEQVTAARRRALDGAKATWPDGRIPVDVLVRTSGETRISNFLLWQINGCKVYFTDRPWPDFDAAELDRALALLDGNG